MGYSYRINWGGSEEIYCDVCKERIEKGEAYYKLCRWNPPKKFIKCSNCYQKMSAYVPKKKRKDYTMTDIMKYRKVALLNYQLSPKLKENEVIINFLQDPTKYTYWDYSAIPDIVIKSYKTHLPRLSKTMLARIFKEYNSIRKKRGNNRLIDNSKRLWPLTHTEYSRYLQRFIKQKFQADSQTISKYSKISTYFHFYLLKTERGFKIVCNS